MKNKLKRILLLAGLTVFLTGCSDAGIGVEKKESEANKVEKSQSQQIQNYKLEDKNSIYENDDPESVVTMYLTVRQGSASENANHTWSEINEHSVYYYQDLEIARYQADAILQVGDENGPLPEEYGYGELVPNATVQIRGQTSSRREQKNYKIRIKDGKGSWREQQTIALNKHISEGLRFRNKMAYDLMKDIPQMMSARTQFVHLYVKDETEGNGAGFEDYGLYTQVEQINKTYLRSHGLDRNGQLYKVNFFEYYYNDVLKLKTDPDYDVNEFEGLLEIKGNDDHTKLLSMINDVNDYNQNIQNVVDKYFDTENLMYWMAFHILIGNADTEARNYYLYSPLNSEKFYIISWDNDASFMRKEFEIRGTMDGYEWQRGISNYWGNVLYNRMFKEDEYREQLDRAVNDLKENYLTEEKIRERADRYAAVTRPYLGLMPDIMYLPLTTEQYDSVLGAIPNEVEENYQYYMESLEKPQPFFIDVPIVEGENLVYRWDAAYDFDGEEVTYTFELNDDFNFDNPIYKEENMILPTVTLDKLSPGKYFIRVKAQNESGMEQVPFDYYITEAGKEYGVKCFYVLEDGSIEEDVVEE